MTQLSIRTAHPDEFAQCGELCVNAYVAGGHLDSANPYAQTLRDVAARATSTETLVALRDDAIVGTVTICPAESDWSEVCRPGELEFRFLAVEPTSWRQGVGEALVAACEDRARSAHATAMVISVIDINEAAHRMYRRLGFERTPDRDWAPVPSARLLAYRRPVPYAG
jgi:GNAT superfamily N-acetyltransferase